MFRELVNAVMDTEKRKSPYWRSVNVAEEHECWEWTGDVDIVTGFGVSRKIVAGDEIVRGAHRLAFILSYGAVPAHHIVRHRCRNKLCCNPAHLIPMRRHPEEDDEHLVTLYYYESKRPLSLSEFERQRIKMLRADGFTLRRMAEHFKVSVSTVSRSLRGYPRDNT